MAGCAGRRLGDLEWLDVLNNVDLIGLNFPPWGGIIEYNGAPILVLIGPPRDDVTNWIAGRPTNSEVFLTDVSNCPEFVATLKNYGSYDSDSDSMFAHLPAEMWERSKEVIATALVTAPAEMQKKLQEASEAAGKAAAAALGPIVGAFAPVLIVALVILGLVYLPRPHGN